VVELQRGIFLDARAPIAHKPPLRQESAPPVAVEG
jgi:hypothetical protein